MSRTGDAPAPTALRPDPAAPAGVAWRRAGPADAGALAAFAARTFTETYAPTSRAEDVAAYVAAHFGPAAQRAELADPTLRTLLVVEATGEPAAAGERLADGALRAYAQLRRAPLPADAPRLPGAALPPGDGWAELARLYVDRPAHGRGLAARLLAAVAAEARAVGADRLWLAAWQGNARALAFYRKHALAPVATATFAMGAELQHDWLLAAPLDALAAALPPPPPAA